LALASFDRRNEEKNVFIEREIHDRDDATLIAETGHGSIPQGGDGRAICKPRNDGHEVLIDENDHVVPRQKAGAGVASHQACVLERNAHSDQSRVHEPIEEEG
jgi:hypothetical protein